MAKILIIDDEKAIRNTLREILEYEGYQIEEASNGEEGIQKIESDDFDMVLCDVKMPKMDGMAVLNKVKEIDEDLPIVMISGHGNVEMAVEATKKGAYDFIVKPPDLNKLLITVRNSIDKKELVVETKVLRRRASKTRDIIGESPAIKNILDTIDKVAPTDARVLITGENGTGKELVARWIHEKSLRAKQPLIEVNCAAIPTELIESELFGHEKGAFTSAIKQRIGKFEQAHNGTIFLDEVGDMSLSAQAKVLRALQENKITRVGGEKDIEVDVRVIAATNKNLLKEIEKGNFRMDLYHRISVILIHVPSLHDRRDDIPLLADKFIKEVCEDGGLPKKSFMPQALEEFKKLNFSGNIRELRNIVERLVILGQNRITVEDIQKFASPINARDEEKSIYERFNTLQDFKEYVERIFIEEKLKKNGWNVAKTAAEIDIQRSHLYNKIEKYSLKRGEGND
jgi:two-component system, NtrC family, nitrogen regulation response regulator NtrX